MALVRNAVDAHGRLARTMRLGWSDRGRTTMLELAVSLAADHAPGPRSVPADSESRGGGIDPPAPTLGGPLARGLSDTWDPRQALADALGAWIHATNELNGTVRLIVGEAWSATPQGWRAQRGAHQRAGESARVCRPHWDAGYHEVPAAVLHASVHGHGPHDWCGACHKRAKVTGAPPSVEDIRAYESTEGRKRRWPAVDPGSSSMRAG